MGYYAGTVTSVGLRHCYLFALADACKGQHDPGTGHHGIAPSFLLDQRIPVNNFSSVTFSARAIFPTFASEMFCLPRSILPM